MIKLTFEGNLLTKSKAADNTKDERIGYLYNSLDQLTSETSTIDANDASYRYDPNGLMTQQVKGTGGSAVTTRYLWDLRKRMAAVDATECDVTLFP